MGQPSGIIPPPSMGSIPGVGGGSGLMGIGGVGAPSGIKIPSMMSSLGPAPTRLLGAPSALG